MSTTTITNQVTTSEQKEYFIFNKKKKSYDELGVPLSQDMLDMELTTFMLQVNKDTIERQVTKMIRIRAMSNNKNEDGKRVRKEFLIWYENWFGYDIASNPIKELGDVPFGFDFEISKSQIYRSSTGKILPITSKAPALDKIYLEEFSKEKCQEIIDNAVLTDDSKIQWIVEGSGSFGGYSMDEFLNLEFRELEVRAQTGKVGYGLDYLFSKEPTVQRLQREEIERTDKKK